MEELKMVQQKCKRCGYVFSDTEKGDRWEHGCFECVCGKEICFFDPQPDDISNIPGIGPKKEKLLKKANIKTFKDLINSNTKVKAPEIPGVSVASLNKWKQKARKLLKRFESSI